MAFVVDRRSYWNHRILILDIEEHFRRVFDKKTQVPWTPFFCGVVPSCAVLLVLSDSLGDFQQYLDYFCVSIVETSNRSMQCGLASYLSVHGVSTEFEQGLH